MLTDQVDNMVRSLVNEMDFSVTGVMATSTPTAGAPDAAATTTAYPATIALTTDAPAGTTVPMLAVDALGSRASAARVLRS